MRKLVVTEFMSLDGVVQAPAYADEDTSNGFAHGGWHARFLEDTSMKWVIDNVARAGGFLFGRRTYETFAAHWPDASEQERPLSEPLNRLPKYVASTTLAAPLGWQNSRLLGRDVVADVIDLKREEGDYLLAIGSTILAHALGAHDLVDEYRLMIDPIVLGGGKRLFRDDGVLRSFELSDATVTSTGSTLATYSRI